MLLYSNGSFYKYRIKNMSTKLQDNQETGGL